ncbi:MAG: TolC family protein [Chitinophagaceae bacterium]
MKNTVRSIQLIIALVTCSISFGQKASDSLLQAANLKDCISYALKHQPLVRQSLIDQQIADNTIKAQLAEWFPQLGLTYTLQHYLKLPTSFVPDPSTGVKRPTQFGVRNTSNFGFGISQSIFSPELLLANRTARDVRIQALQNTTYNKIDVVVNVSKAFYDLLLTEKQVDVLDENIVRLERSYKDAYNQYEGGIVDKIDYKRAQISLNNTKAERKRAIDLIPSKYAILKQLMGYPPAADIDVVYDSIQMEKDVFIDTLAKVKYDNRIETQQLETQRNLLTANLQYNKWRFLPTASANGNFTPTFQNDQFSKLYSQNFPSSYIGLSIGFPIFQGGKRVYNIRNANLQLVRLNWDITALHNQIDAEYSQSLSNYKGSLADWQALKENLILANDVYSTLRLQYNAGIKTYLDVIISETDLRTAQLNYLNALYQVLASKLDMQRSTGAVSF